MNKLKMLVLTALAAATVGIGALAAAPSASAATTTHASATLAGPRICFPILGRYSTRPIKKLIVVVTAALALATTAGAATVRESSVGVTASERTMQPAATGWCGQTSGGNRQYRIRAHNLGCAGARSLAHAYMSTGRYPRGYSCAASILYCWTQRHARWFRGYLISAPPPPAPPPPAAVGTRSNPFPLGTSAHDSRWSLRVNPVNWDAWPLVQAENMFNDPPPAGYVEVMANLTGQYLGPGSSSIIDFSIIYGVVGSDGVVRTSFSGPTCGVLPPPRDIDYTPFISGATFYLNDCWVVPVSQIGSLELYWDDVFAHTTGWWALR